MLDRVLNTLLSPYLFSELSTSITTISSSHNTTNANGFSFSLSIFLIAKKSIIFDVKSNTTCTLFRSKTDIQCLSP